MATSSAPASPPRPPGDLEMGSVKPLSDSLVPSSKKQLTITTGTGGDQTSAPASTIAGKARPGGVEPGVLIRTGSRYMYDNPNRNSLCGRTQTTKSFAGAQDSIVCVRWLLRARLLRRHCSSRLASCFWRVRSFYHLLPAAYRNCVQRRGRNVHVRARAAAAAGALLR